MVDDLDDDHNFYDLVDIYVKEHPQYGHSNIELTDALYSDTSDGKYPTEIIMPSGLIEITRIPGLHRRSCIRWR